MMFGEAPRVFNSEQERKDAYDNDVQMIMAFRNSFGLDAENEEAKGVLTAILYRLGFFHPIESDEDVANHNSCLRILHDCGIWREGNGQEIVEALSRTVTVWEEGEVNE